MNVRRLKARIMIFFHKMKFRNISIVYKMTLIYATVFSLVIFLSYTNFKFYSNDKENSTLKVIKLTNIQTVNKIDDYIKDLINITKFPLTRRSYNTAGNTSYLSALDEYDYLDTASLAFRNFSDQMFYDIFECKTSIHSAFVYNTKGSSVYKIKEGMYKPYNPVNEEWFKKSISSFGKPIFVSTYQIENLYNTAKKPIYVFAVTRGILNVTEAKIIGVILINTKTDFLADICKKMLIAPGQRIIIDDSEGNIIYDTNEKILSF